MPQTLSVVFPFRGTGQQPCKREENLAKTIAHYRQIFPKAHYVLCNDPDPETFNRGRALNEGMKIVKEDIVIFADADIVVQEASLRKAVRIVTENPSIGYVVPFCRIRFEAGPGSPEREVEGKITGGVNVLRRETFEAVNGFDPRFRGWGAEDVAFGAAVATLRGRLEWVGGQVAFHQWHPSCRAEGTEARALALVLLAQYEEARGNPEMMRELIKHGKA